MKRIVVLVSVAAVVTAVAAGVAWAAVIACPTGPGGVCVGTNNNDTLNGRAVFDNERGRAGADILNGRGANDLLHGGTGPDTVRGQDGNDELRGDAGRDVLRGNIGDDVINSVDNTAGNDTVDGGDGNDVCTINFSLEGDSEFRDKVVGGFGDASSCERINLRGASNHVGDPVNLF